MVERLNHKFNFGECMFDALEAHHKNPHDAAHNWENHHLPVLKNINEIVEGEQLKGKVDIKALLIAGAWHDYKRHSGDFLDMKAGLLKNGANNDFIEKVIGIINEHSHGSNRKSLEGKILWAADKIEYVSKDRYVASINDMKKLKVFLYKLLWRQRLPIVKNEIEKCGLETAASMFNIKYSELVKFVNESNPKDTKWFKGVS